MRSIFVILFFNLFFLIVSNENHQEQLNLLKKELTKQGVPEIWFVANVNHEKFTIYQKMNSYFNNMSERKVSTQQKDLNWYFNHFGVHTKIKKGKVFLNEHYETLVHAENTTKTPKELIVAILGIESDYGNPRYKGNFYVFPALVSQFILIENRRNFAIKELVALYKFEKIINESTYYFLGSFAGACGWGQFLPSSLLNYFLPYQAELPESDIYDLQHMSMSIGNYLQLVGTKHKDIAEPKVLYETVYSYNHSDAYVKAVIAIYQGLKIDN